MSILQQVIEEYGEFGSGEPKPPTDKTAKSPFVSFGSEWSELLKNKEGELTAEEVQCAAEMVAITEMREQGIVPDHYTASTECGHCGRVPIFEGLPAKVKGCPWCFNSIKGLPIPGVTINE